MGRIAVHFIGTQEDEDRVWAMKARRFQKIHSAQRVDLEIEDGDIASLVMGRLRGAMDNQVKPVGTEKSFQGDAVSNVQIVMCEIPGAAAKAPEIPHCVALFAEENSAHVVVNTVDQVTLPVEIFHCFRADQAAGTSNKNCLYRHL